jgi:hypothetical protein
MDAASLLKGNAIFSYFLRVPIAIGIRSSSKSVEKKRGLKKLVANSGK